MGSHHDSAFRQLFAHPEVVCELLRGYLPAEWIQDFDFASLERVSGSYVSEDGAQRHSDMVWKLRVSSRWLYLYVLLEFQATPDRWMALRINAYTCLMYQDLVKRHELPQSGNLPPVLPLVLYCGKKPWRSATSLKQLIEPAQLTLDAMQPEQHYLLVNLREADADRGGVGVALTYLFQLRYMWKATDVPKALARIKAWLASENCAELSVTVGQWLQLCLSRGVAGATLESTGKVEGGAMMKVPMLRHPDFDTFEEKFAYSMEQTGKQKLLTRQLLQKFGEVPAHYEFRMKIGIEEDFDLWVDRLPTAKTIDEVFEPDPADEE